MICAFPYVIAFTNESMEIRLLVNGNLVHMATMAELKLITNKTDIFFTTTAPEFIPRSSRIKGLEYDESPLSNGGGDTSGTPTHQKVYPKINDISDERILEIKNKMEKIEAQTTTESVDSSESQESQDEYNGPQNGGGGVLINQKDNLNRLAVAESTDLPSIQRARSLQGKDNKHRDSLEEKRRQISKSNSCGESTIVTNGAVTPTHAHIKAQEPSVPPNSPKVKEVVGAAQLQGSPNTKSKQSHNSSECSPGKVKPLRIYRIPLSNLIGTSHHHHHQHHTHHSNNLHNNFTNPTKIQASKIAEDHSEDSENGNRSSSKADEML